MTQNVNNIWSSKETFWLFCLILVSTIFSVKFMESLLRSIGLEAFDLMHLASSGGTVLATVLLYYLIKIKSQRPITDYLAVKRIEETSLFVKYFLLYLIYLLFLDFVGSNFEFPEKNDHLNRVLGSKYMLLAGLASCLIAPIVEEVLFRGFLFRGWVTSKDHAHVRIIIISILFTAIHAGQYNWLTLLTILPLSLLLGYARYHSGSLLLPIYIHIGHNTLVFTLNITQ